MTDGQPYHHGNLRVALVDAARALAAEKGADGVTLRAVARAAGVSHTAAYHHFSGKDALLDAVAARCFADCHAHLAEARDGVDGSPRQKIYAVGRAYLHFALERPNDFDLMTRHAAVLPDTDDVADVTISDELLTTATAAAAVLIDLLPQALDPGELPPGPPEQYILTYWVSVHGLAVLMRDRAAGRIFGMPLGEGEPDDLYDVGFSAIWT